MRDPSAFIRANTELVSPPLVPEVRLHLATELVPIWRLTEDELQAQGVDPPYWAFAWAGGQALARYILDNSDCVKGRLVLDFGSGSGLVGIAARLAGASRVVCADIDRFALSAIALNAQVNNVDIQTTADDVTNANGIWTAILIGDMCYERALALRVLSWARRHVAAGSLVLLGDPGRTYFPKSGVEKLSTFKVQTTRELEDREIRETAVYRLLA